MATVVDALVVSLGLDAKDFQTNLKQADAALKQFQKDAKVNIGGALKSTASGISQGLSAFRGMLISRMGWQAVGGLKDMAEEMVQTQFKAQRMAKAFGVNAQELQAWQKAVQVAGGSPENFNKSIENMVANLRKVGMGLAGVRMSGFGLGLGLGISSFGNPLRTMESLAKTMRGMDMGRALVIGQKLGIDRDTIYMLHQGGAELLRLVNQMRELGSPTEEQLARTNQLRMQMEVFKLTIGRVKEQLLIALAPALKFVTDKLTDLSNWAKEHPKAIEYAFYGIAAALGAATVAMTAFTVATLMTPVINIVAGISIAIGLLAVGVKYLYDEWAKGSGDVYTALKPVVAALKQLWEFMRPAILWEIGARLAYFKEILGAVGGLLQGIVQMLAGNWSGADKSFDKMIEHMMTGVKILANYTAGEIGYLVGTLTRQFEDLAKGKLWGFLKKYGSIATSPAGFVTYKAYDWLSGTRTAATEPTAKAGKGVDVSIGNIIVTVPEGTKDPEGFIRSIRPELESEFRKWGVSVLVPH